MWNSSINVMLFDHFRCHFAILAQKASFPTGFIRFWASGFIMCVLPIKLNVFCDFWGARNAIWTTFYPFWALFHLGKFSGSWRIFQDFGILKFFWKIFENLRRFFFAKTFDLKENWTLVGGSLAGLAGRKGSPLCESYSSPEGYGNYVSHEG